MYDCNAEVVVLLTVYNRKSIKNTIESVLGQTFEDFQLLIIDNASDDGTYEIVKSYADRDSRVVVVRNDKNMGQTYSLHRGMLLAKGKYIARIDADDLMERRRLEKQYRFLESNPEYGFCGSWVQLITDDDVLGMVVKTCTTDFGLRIMQYISCGAYHPSVMMRRSTLDLNSISYDKSLKMAEDYDMWRQILSVSKGLNLSEVLTFYRRGENNDSKHHEKTTFKEAFIVKERILEATDDIAVKKMLSSSIKLEQKERKSVIEVGHIINAYKNVISKVDKESPDYGIIRIRLRFYLIGVLINHNTALWAKIMCKIYEKARKIRYFSYKMK